MIYLISKSEFSSELFIAFARTILENHGNLIGLSKMPHIFEDEIDRIELVGQAVKQTPSYAEKYKRQMKKKKEIFSYRVLNFIQKLNEILFLKANLKNTQMMKISFYCIITIRIF